MNVPEKVVAEIRPGESRRVPFDSVAVNAIVGSDEFGTHEMLSERPTKAIRVPPPSSILP